jgi:hypothetical protein
MCNSHLNREDVRALYTWFAWRFRIGLIVTAIGVSLLCLVINYTNASASNKFHQRHQEMCLRNNGTKASCQESWELLSDMTGYQENTDVDVCEFVVRLIFLCESCCVLCCLAWTSGPRSNGALFLTSIWVAMYTVDAMIYNDPQEETDEKESE